MKTHYGPTPEGWPHKGNVLCGNYSDNAVISNDLRKITCKSCRKVLKARRNYAHVR